MKDQLKEQLQEAVRPLRMSIQIDDDWLALVAYRVALQKIAAMAEEQSWAHNEAAEMAKAVLDAFDKDA